jgi:hypothetical protein
MFFMQRNDSLNYSRNIKGIHYYCVFEFDELRKYAAYDKLRDINKPLISGDTLCIFMRSKEKFEAVPYGNGRNILMQ